MGQAALSGGKVWRKPILWLQIVVGQLRFFGPGWRLIVVNPLNYGR